MTKEDFIIQAAAEAILYAELKAQPDTILVPDWLVVVVKRWERRAKRAAHRTKHGQKKHGGEWPK